MNAQLIARSACIQYLESDRPAGGWRSSQAAVDAVAPKVENMMSKQGKEIDVCALLYVWLNGDPDVQKAGGSECAVQKNDRCVA